MSTGSWSFPESRHSENLKISLTCKTTFRILDPLKKKFLSN
jgi:hypothetical protein